MLVTALGEFEVAGGPRAWSERALLSHDSLDEKISRVTLDYYKLTSRFQVYGAHGLLVEAPRGPPCR